MVQATLERQGTLCLSIAKEHNRYIRLQQPEKSGLAEHCLPTGHTTLFNETMVYLDPGNAFGFGIFLLLSFQLFGHSNYLISV